MYLQRPGVAHYAPGDDSLEADMQRSILYTGMAAEGSKERARLKKRVKRLGVRQVRIEGVAPEKTATFSCEKPWQEITTEYEGRSSEARILLG